jgi:hypothetical protein
MYDGPIKCTYLLEEHEPGKESKIKIELEHQDGSPLSPNETPDIGQNEWPHAIPISSQPLTWKLSNYTPDIPDSYWQRRCFATMFRSVALVIPQKFQFQRQDLTSFFNIEFTHDLEVFDGNNPKYNGLQQWNDNHFFTPFGDSLPAWMVDSDNYTEGEKFANGNIKTLPTQPMLQIGMHELDHNMGFRHDLLDKSSLLYPFVKPGVTKYVNGDSVHNLINEENFKRTEKDLQRYEAKYGRRNIALRWFRHMRARRVRARKVADVPYWVAV